MMKTVWAHAPISTPQVTKLLAAQNDWSPKTVQTLLSRLVKKRALTYEKRGRVFFLYPSGKGGGDLKTGDRLFSQPLL
ncbi:hypothetical protein HMPREF1011_00530 [Anaerostipes caccae]|nr:hypothetical protein HMPREF1011_00530 [Anaerostipes caccae]